MSTHALATERRPRRSPSQKLLGCLVALLASGCGMVQLPGIQVGTGSGPASASSPLGAASARAPNLDWVKDTKVQRVTLKQPLAEAVILSGGPGGQPRPVEYCRRYTGFPETPLAIIEVADQPLVDLELELHTTYQHVTLALVGPLTPGGSNPQVACDEITGTHRYSRLEPGTYGLFIGGNEKTTPTVTNVVLAKQDSKRDPLRPAPSMPSSLELYERDLLLHYPLLTYRDVFKSDELRARLFAAAPAELFVFPKYNLDKDTAHWQSAGETTSGEGLWPGKDVPALGYPVKDEPLLMFGGSLLTADGLIFNIKQADLSPKPAGAVAFPERVRNPQLSWNASRHHRLGKGDEAVLSTFYTKAQKPYDDCVNKVWAKPNARIAELGRQPPSALRNQQVQNIRNKAYNDQAARCSLRKLDEARDKAWAALIKTRTARRDAQLAAAKKRIAALLTSKS